MIRLSRIGQLFAAMIVVILAALAPSAVQAHAGHDHAPAAAVVIGTVAEPMINGALIAPATVLTVGTSAANRSPEEPLPCNGTCCSGAFCGAPALLPDPAAATFHRLGSAACWPGDRPVSAGTDPRIPP